MRSFFPSLACAALLVLPGCATKPFASIWRVREDVGNEMSDALHDAGRQVSKTWSDMWRDWNYVEEDSFGEIRNAAGQ